VYPRLRAPALSLLIERPMLGPSSDGGRKASGACLVAVEFDGIGVVFCFITFVNVKNVTALKQLIAPFSIIGGRWLLYERKVFITFFSGKNEIILTYLQAHLSILGDRV
jgi:hypothetical protein